MAAPAGSGSATPRPGTSQNAGFSPAASAPLTALTNSKFRAPGSSKTPKVDQVGPASFPDKEYFESYANYREKRMRPNRKLEIRAFVCLQHLIIERLGRKVESLNGEILQAGDNEWEKLEEARSLIHTYCELACLCFSYSRLQ
jgi:hypothetical protein